MAHSTTPQPTPRVESTTRVDHAHGIDGHGPEADRLEGHDAAHGQPSEPSIDLLQAIAGFDARLANHQMRAQALELAALLREKQRLLEQRESELNARSAILENEWRTARLRQQAQHGAPLAVEGNAASPQSTEPAQEASVAHERTVEAHPRTADHLFAADVNLLPWHSETAPMPPQRRTTVASSSREATPSDNSESLDLDIELTARETALDFDFQKEWEQLQEHRRQLHEKETSLQRREAHLEHAHEEVMTLHRESLEMRLATEQAWADLLPHLSRPDLTQTIARLRLQLADHYRLAHDAIQRRKDELLELRDQLQQQDQRLRQHRRDIQLWADRRYDEIEARAARLAVRERELDRVEADLQSQSLQWQRQRELYREEIERLSWQVRDQTCQSVS